MDEFSNASSQLVKSFWAGKVLQELRLTEEDLSSIKDAAEGHLPPSPHDTLISDALCCLATCETSLSVRVHSIVTSEEIKEGTAMYSETPSVMHSDGTLNWTQLTEWYLEGEGD